MDGIGADDYNPFGAIGSTDDSAVNGYPDEGGYPPFSTGADGFVGLGYDVLWIIARYCIDVRSIVRLGMTCRTLRSFLLDEDDNVWRLVVKERGLCGSMSEYKRLLAASGGRDCDEDESNEKRTDAIGVGGGHPFVKGLPEFVSWKSIARRHLAQQHFRFFSELVEAIVLGMTQNKAGGSSTVVTSLPPWEFETEHSKSAEVIDDSGAKKKLAVRSTLRRLSSIDMAGGICVGKTGAWVLASALKFTDTLDALVLPGQNLGTHGAQLIALAAAGCSSKVFTENLNATIPPKSDAAPVEKGKHGAVSGGKKDNNKLNTCPLSFSVLQRDALSTAPTEVKETVRSFFLRDHDDQGKNDGAGGSLRLALGGGFARSLTRLILDENKIEGEAGALAIASIISQCPQLVVLSARKNQIDDKGARCIANAIERMAQRPVSGAVELERSSTQLTPLLLCRVYLDENPIKDGGVHAMVGAFSSLVASQTRRAHQLSALERRLADEEEKKKRQQAENQSSNLDGHQRLLQHKRKQKLPLASVRRAHFVLSLEGCGLTAPPLNTLSDLRFALHDLCATIRAADETFTSGGGAATDDKECAPYVRSTTRDTSKDLPSVTLFLGNNRRTRVGRNKIGPKDRIKLKRVVEEEEVEQYQQEHNDADTSSASARDARVGHKRDASNALVLLRFNVNTDLIDEGADISQESSDAGGKCICM